MTDSSFALWGSSASTLKSDGRWYSILRLCLPSYMASLEDYPSLPLSHNHAPVIVDR